MFTNVSVSRSNEAIPGADTVGRARMGWLGRFVAVAAGTSATWVRVVSGSGVREGGRVADRAGGRVGGTRVDVARVVGGGGGVAVGGSGAAGALPRSKRGSM